MLQNPHFYVLKHEVLMEPNKSTINEKTLTQFIHNYVNNKLKPYYKSEPLGTYEIENSNNFLVRTIVGE